MGFIQVLECLFENTWNVVASIDYPGTGIPIAAILIGFFIICLAIRIISSLFGSGGSK